MQLSRQTSSPPSPSRRSAMHRSGDLKTLCIVMHTVLRVFCLIFSNVCHVSVSVISSSRQLTEVAKVLGRTAIYSVEHSRWLIFFFYFWCFCPNWNGTCEKILGVKTYAHTTKICVLPSLYANFSVLRSQVSQRDSFFFQISFSKPSKTHIFFWCDFIWCASIFIGQHQKLREIHRSEMAINIALPRGAACPVLLAASGRRWQWQHVSRWMTLESATSQEKKSNPHDVKTNEIYENLWKPVEIS